MTRLLLKGGRVVDPVNDIDDIMDILIEDGLIKKIGKNISAGGQKSRKGNALETVDISGMTAVPGLIDMHTHLREPGFEYKETIRTGSEAAAAGGFSAIACMANTQPVNDNRSVTELILGKAAQCALVRVYPVAAISLALKGETLSEFQDLKVAGAVAFSDDGKPVKDASLMRRAVEYAASIHMPVISHCEDLSLSAGGAMNEGFASTELGLRGIPGIAEDIMVAREILIAEFTGASVHIAHVSTAGAVGLIRNAKKMRIPITAETAPHYFTLTDGAVRGFDTNTKVNPPLRGSEDVQAVKEGLRDGTIDVIASDHAPHAVTDKQVEYDYASSGIVGLETSLGLSLALVAEGILSLNDLIRKMSVNPARILKVPGGTLAPSSAADITVIDLRKAWTVDVSSFRSRSRNTPFNGRTLYGKAVMTIVGGEIKYRG
jgi:dihydroorotase